MEFTEETVTDFESRLSEVIELYQHRIHWLLQDSRKVFGVIKGTKVGLLVDVSHLSYGPRLLDFQKNLLCLIDEQLCYKKQLYCLSFSTEISPLWESPKTINVHVLHEVRQWIQELEPGQGCNLLKALRHVLPMKELNCLVLIVGSCPDQSFEILCDYVQQCTLGRKVQIHTVTYDCSNPASLTALKNLAEAVRGCYHCYSSKGENCDSSDFNVLLQESQKAKDLLKSIKQTFQRRVGSLLDSKTADVSTAFANTEPSSFFPKPPKHKGPLVIQTPGILAKTSADWLKTYGLKAKKLDLYQVLAPNAFSPVEDFVPILQKTVSSTLHEKVMMQFEWYDGTVKNIHVDLPVLYSYQKLLAKMVRIYERRIDWLSVASRRIWGTVCERRVVILVDISVTNSTYISHIQHSLRLLLEEQMSDKDHFNIIAFGSDIVPWQQELLPSQPENLEKAWRWVLSLECKGSRNFMSALRRAVEVDFKDKDKYKSQGLYLLTTGIPDQETHTISAYVAEACGGFDLQLHVCLFSVRKGTDPSGIIPARYANPMETANAFKEIVQATKGRFHWFGEAGIFESDDITSIISEMEKAKNYSQKCAFLVESLKQRSVNQSVKLLTPKGHSNVLMRNEGKKNQKVPSSKPTAVLKDIKDNHGAERNTPVRIVAWRPPSARAGIPPAQTINSQNEHKGKHKARKQAELSVSVFYTEEGRNVGTIYQRYPKAVHVRKSVCSVTLPKEEEICSSKEWLTKYSIKKLKLDLPRLMLGCTHQKKTVECLHKKVSAKYCSIFPSAEINGVVKHLQLHPKELETYTEQLEKVLQRYIQRVQWLLSGSRRLFGTILEANVCVLIDTSGSMSPYLPSVTKELTSLIWEQLRKNEARFNLLRFAENIESWKEYLVEATDGSCHDAVQWASTYHAHGTSCILAALQKALSFQGVKALYLLTDGKPDTSCSLILKEIEELIKKQDIKIHTICFSCADRGAVEFLKKLASQTGGRFHCSSGGEDGQLAAHRILTEGLDDEDNPVFPYFEGDDLKKLTQEVAKARSFLKQAKSWRLLLENWNTNQKDDSGFQKSVQD
ncbi:von Willebrand factor A domain-containing protein 3A isoform X1 [Catharus ustulatus]|uniref:von Willebrand factor A domain-containing protein 3A isoform X1 n=1 Tax=Catharus ustulatus TaxID=91951 RepID=UPI00140CE565|nr:von Willebrand factor A domain-containing protein 3A isoform X1 [Catharus ustulatus]XP_032929986.1 von Willebrand factor A domain-containing protein 3A isoform X1 [Catharus ustulatus]XP_032929988.1 von Willebrand factor A domain-containing protein 3A isoform X1 [Catharus ustulatus]XP_032929989.1 von Willebrand factor A domain-containing protein 3A isoform X1 [Catharus ustulatus]XP_032929990.1 von Willebrand factor A domain-containing protein 3A isoform X1 [Catharus ustulatus]XP_032929991.1 